MLSTNKSDASWFMRVVKEQDMEAFHSIEKTFVKTYDDSSESPLHIVAVFGTSKMIECMQKWTGVDWDRRYVVHENKFQDASKTQAVRKATALYLATFLDRTEVTESLLKLAGEDNISNCLQEIPMSNGMEQIYTLELAERLKQKHSELKPTVIPGHQRDKNGVRSRVFIVYSVSVIQADEYDFNGLGLVKLQNPYVFKRTKYFESDINMKLSVEGAKRVGTAIQIHREMLWNNHSNLNIITGSNVKSRTNGSVVEKTACVVLYCSTKGVIPMGEDEFPRQLRINNDDSIDVYVREGFFAYGGYQTSPSTSPHQTLKMGCNIGRLTPQWDARGHLLPNLGGTLGPFVKYNGNDGFLTCAHVLFDIPSPTHVIDFTGDINNLIEVVQPSMDSTVYQYGNGGTGGAACGIVDRARFLPNLPTSVDAAVVRITDPARKPTNGQFSNERPSSYRDADFKELPEYNSGLMLKVDGINRFRNLNPKTTEPVIVVKFGSKTDVTKGSLCPSAADVRTLSTVLGLPNEAGMVPMINQYRVTGIYPSANFFEKGDSGSGVFIKDNNGDLHCIGMAIGTATLSDYLYQAGVVTPIDAVLDELGPNLSLATFP
ncbi:uncharacterized protein LOC117341496 [Pecten maximus]|uniref:uncharacterized protein LOC117341496 n=1 Tax=Pecten maximus TaxID=6579 RepID=UPI001458B305|nr:uncharacterized protein LOC117341496 [Pecten maximus]